MNAMQTELESTYPALKIQLLGVNQRGQEPGNTSTTAGRNLPWLQDVDEDQNGSGDVADDLWDVAFRDVVILDGENVQVNAFNLSSNDLGDAEHYATLREMLVDAAMLSQLPWMNAANPLDIDDSGAVVPLDVLLLINELDNQGSQELPPPTGTELTQPFYDANGDGLLTPLDPLQIINFFNEDQDQAEGESQLLGRQSAPEPDSQLPASPAITPDSGDTRDDGADLDDGANLDDGADWNVRQARGDQASEDAADAERDRRESREKDVDAPFGLDYFHLPISATRASSSGN